MLKGEIRRGQAPVIQAGQSTRSKEAKKSPEAKGGNRAGLVTAMLSHYAAFLALKGGAVCPERSP